jgi:hypothetical protein
VQLVVDDGQPTSGVHLRGQPEPTSSADGTMRNGVEFVSLTPVEVAVRGAPTESMTAVPDPE